MSLVARSNYSGGDQFERLSTHFNDRQIVELTPRTTLYNFPQIFFDVLEIDMANKAASFYYRG